MHVCTPLELSSVQAMSAVLCCGPAFDSKALNDENDIVYTWLNTLLGTHHEEVSVANRKKKTIEGFAAARSGGEGQCA